MINPVLQNSRIDKLPSFYKSHTTIDVLRLDLIHPVISGNKWFKLQGYLRKAEREGRDTLLTFGGAYSNHIVATAAACALSGHKCIGIIRGERPPELSPTLMEAAGYGMQLHFISRESYRTKPVPGSIWEEHTPDKVLVIGEGGYGREGVEGAGGICDAVPDLEQYTHLMAAVGTGTTLAGIRLHSHPTQEVIGISALKNNYSLLQEINNLLPPELTDQFRLLHHYHFGGYARHSEDLIRFMNRWYAYSGIPTDFVYTAKLFYALEEMIKGEEIPDGSRVLVIHSGGLQGNRSLPKGTLIF